MTSSISSSLSSSSVPAPPVVSAASGDHVERAEFTIPPEHAEVLQSALSSGRLIIVAGAGTTIAAVPERRAKLSWPALIKSGWEYLALQEPHAAALYKHRQQSVDLAMAIPTPEHQVDQLLLEAELLQVALRDKKHFTEWLNASFEFVAPDHNLLNALRTLQQRGAKLATTNYDLLLENNRADKAIVPQDAAAVKAWLHGRAWAKSSVLHWHGHYKQPDGIVLGKRDYRQVVDSEYNKLFDQSLLFNHTVLFVGTGSGLSDPHLQQTIRMFTSYFPEKYSHDLYCLVRTQDCAALQQIHPKIHFLPYGPSYDLLDKAMDDLFPNYFALVKFVDDDRVVTNTAVPDYWAAGLADGRVFIHHFPKLVQEAHQQTYRVYTPMDERYEVIRHVDMSGDQWNNHLFILFAVGARDEYDSDSFHVQQVGPTNSDFEKPRVKSKTADPWLSTGQSWDIPHKLIPRGITVMRLEHTGPKHNPFVFVSMRNEPKLYTIHLDVRRPVEFKHWDGFEPTPDCRFLDVASNNREHLFIACSTLPPVDKAKDGKEEAGVIHFLCDVDEDGSDHAVLRASEHRYWFPFDQTRQNNNAALCVTRAASHVVIYVEDPACILVYDVFTTHALECYAFKDSAVQSKYESRLRGAVVIQVDDWNFHRLTALPGTDIFVLPGSHEVRLYNINEKRWKKKTSTA